MHVEARGWCQVSSIMFYFLLQFTEPRPARLAGQQATGMLLSLLPWHWSYTDAKDQTLVIMPVWQVLHHPPSAQP